MNLSFEDIIRWVNTPLIHVGETPVTFSGFGTTLIIILGALFLSRLLSKAIRKPLKEKFNLDSGVIYAIERFIHYGVVVLGVIVASQSIGLNLGSLAVIFGFLSVGIGFGLQNLTSNFISGIILLLERPISVGDWIEVEGKIAQVQDIKMRSTIVMTLDKVVIIVPNSQLIESQVTNWSIVDKRVRLHCPIGVAYGSDVPLVKDVLLKVAGEHKAVLAQPDPEVRFLEFSDSSLNFELLIWVSDPRRQDQIKSDINYLIDDAFRKHSIQIPFPQRDLHIKPSAVFDRFNG